MTSCSLYIGMITDSSICDSPFIKYLFSKSIGQYVKSRFALNDYYTFQCDLLQEKHCKERIYVRLQSVIHDENTLRNV